METQSVRREREREIANALERDCIAKSVWKLEFCEKSQVLRLKRLNKDHETHKNPSNMVSCCWDCVKSSQHFELRASRREWAF